MVLFYSLTQSLVSVNDVRLWLVAGSFTPTEMSNSISLPSLAQNLVSMNDTQLWLVAESFTPTEMSDSMPVTSSEDWTAAFGLKNEDDLGVWCLFFFFLTLEIDTEALPVLVLVRLAICSQNVCRCKSLDCFLFLMSIHVLSCDCSHLAVWDKNLRSLLFF